MKLLKNYKGHIHIIPRYKGDTPDPRGGIRWIWPGRAKYWGDQPRDEAETIDDRH